MIEQLMVRHETQIAAPPATVIAFLTDPEKIISWMSTEAKTEMAGRPLQVWHRCRCAKTDGGVPR